MFRTLDLVLLNLIRFTWACFSVLSWSLWLASQPSGMSAVPLILVPAANWLRVPLILLCHWWKYYTALDPIQTLEGCHFSLISICTLSHQPPPTGGYHLISPTKQSAHQIHIQFREKRIVGDCAKGLTEVQIDDICISSLVHRCNHSIIEGH